MLKMLFTFVSKFQYETLFCGLTPVANLSRDKATLNHVGKYCTDFAVETFDDTTSFRVFKNDLVMTRHAVST